MIARINRQVYTITFSTYSRSIFLFQTVPSQPPTSLQGYNTSSTSIQIHWNNIPPAHKNGIITFYNISFRIQGFSNLPWNNISVNSSIFTTELSNLQKYTLYEIMIAGSTIVGTGKYCNPILVRTDQDGM